MLVSQMKLVIAMTRNARKAEAAGGDAVFDNPVGVMADGASSKGKTVQGLMTDFADGETVTGGMVATVGETSAAKAKLTGDLYQRWHRVAQGMAKTLHTESDSLRAEPESISILNLACASTDRCAAEMGQVKELEALKQEELPLFLGRRFMRIGYGVSVRVVPRGLERCAVEIKVWLPEDSNAAARAKAYVTVNKLAQRLSDAMNCVLAAMPLTPMAFLCSKLVDPKSTRAEAAELAQKADRVSTQFSNRIESYLWTHRVAGNLEAGINRLVAREPDLTNEQACFREMALYVGEIRTFGD